MASLIFDLTKRVTKAENTLATKLQVAALTKDRDEVALLMANPTIKKLFKRGVLKVDRMVLSFDGEDHELG
jgi:hypothetical protein